MSSPDFKNGCVVCGKELVYSEAPYSIKCNICGKEFQTNVSCQDGHYICDTCHSASAMDSIEQICSISPLRDPLRLADMIMQLDSVKMHGPEHHFLVPAVLIATYYHAIGQPEHILAKIKIARKRAETVPGGACGFHGNCGAGVGTGIFMSVVTGANPLSEQSFGWANMITGHCLIAIGEVGGPRCCKRDTYLSIIEACRFIKKHLNVDIPCEKITCRYSDLNNECKMAECDFFG